MGPNRCVKTTTWWKVDKVLMGIILIFSLNVVFQVVIANGVEYNPAPHAIQNTALSEVSAICGIVDYDCEKVNQVESYPIKFTDISVSSENNVALKWQSTVGNALFLLRVSGGTNEKERCLVVDQHYNSTTFSDGKWTYTLPCFDGSPGSVYHVSVLSHNASSSYLIRVPENVDEDSKVPVLAVGESACPSASIHVVFEQPLISYTAAHVLCVDNQDPQNNLSQRLDTNTTVCKFDVEYGRQYTVKLAFKGCDTDCPDPVTVPINSSASCGVTVATSPPPPPPPPPPQTPPPTPGKTTLTPTVPPVSTTEPDGSVVQKPSPRIADNAKRTTIIAVVSAVVAALIIFTAGGCVYRKKRQRDDDAFMMRRLGSGDSDTSSLTTEKAMGASTKANPSVLLLYSYDCEVHERVVIEFAAYLKHECGCEVALDIWEQDTIKTGGAAKWLDEKLDFSDFIIVVGSAGARFKCQRKKQIRMKQSRPVPDMFVYGADRITEKVRFAKQFGHQAPQCVVVCFEYSTASDIPPKLDTLTTLSLMKDISMLYSQLHGTDDDSKCLVEPYTDTPTGRQLAEALKDAVDYFRENLDWLGQCLEPVALSPSESSPSSTPPLPPYSSPKPNSRSRTVSVDSVLEKRQTKRRQEEEIVLPKVPSSNVLVNGNDTPLSLNTIVPAPVNPVINRGRSPSTPPPPVHPVVVPPNLGMVNPAAVPPEEDEEEEEDEEDEMLQLQRDIDFIHNYQYTDHNPTDNLLQLDALSSSYESRGPSYSFSNPLYSQHSSTKHMLQKNGLGRVSVSLNSHKKVKTNYNNNSFVVDFNAIENGGKGDAKDTSTYL